MHLDNMNIQKCRFNLTVTSRFLFHCDLEHSKNFRSSFIYLKILTFKRQPHEMFKHTQTIRRQFADEFFECL